VARPGSAAAVCTSCVDEYRYVIAPDTYVLKHRRNTPNACQYGFYPLATTTYNKYVHIFRAAERERSGTLGNVFFRPPPPPPTTGGG